VTERPIIFKDEMVRQILSGQKTVTRRVIKKQPESWQWIHSYESGGFAVVGPDYESLEFQCPHGQPGDRLWVREAWCPITMREIGQRIFNDGPIPDKTEILYRAGRQVYDGKDMPEGADFEKWPLSWADDVLPEGCKWRPSIHIFKKDSRIDLEVVKIGVERVQEITYEGAMAEGIPETASDAYVAGLLPEDVEGHFWDNNTSVENFSELWNSINQKKGFGWDTNPWVWRVEFRRIH